MTDEIEELKQLEKQAMPETLWSDKPQKRNQSSNTVRAGLFLIALGVVALVIMFSGVNVWKYWWLIFLIKPLLFGWWGPRRHYGWWACGATERPK